ncbi:acylneuraminate cytidylyltransferase family protein [uncultured Aquabacterium sp.]|uniref:acylneuraminate cytidylyltransferase family protein n=1 Tax=uncultured Aquabacterium sp. TaxID=158753 RepID=UPI0025D488EF|nr:acylneuraminate cytidylyltransferase family protein [uncultured Aquabacterium sp.]
MSTTWAIVPARSGSKGYPGKNVATVAGVPLLAHSINFAKKLSFIDRVILSTDSADYASVGEQYGADVPFLRGAEASMDFSMEEDILEDFRVKCERENIPLPTNVLWLRPTHPLRDIQTFESAYKKFSTGQYSSVCVVTPEDPRVFFDQDGLLSPSIKNFEQRSMVRRQDCPPAYRIFGGEIFPFPRAFDPLFLGNRVAFELASKFCKFDIDYEEDLAYLNYLTATTGGAQRLSGLLHPD